jgi:hypothetical protein
VIPSIADVAPAALDRVLKRCLEKEPDNRWQTSRDLKAELEWIAGAPESGSAVPSPNKNSRLVWILGAAASAVALALASVAFIHFREAAIPELAGVQFQITPPEKSTIDYFKLSPDGRSLAFVTGDRLWIRPLNSLEARPRAGTEGASQLFWSPDNRFLAFFAQGKLKKIAASGGPPQDLCNVTQPFGGTWNRDGVIVLPLSLASGLYRVPASAAHRYRFRVAAAQQSPSILNSSGRATFLFSDIGTGRAIGSPHWTELHSSLSQRPLTPSLCPGSRQARRLPAFPAQRRAHGPALQPHRADPQRRRGSPLKELGAIRYGGILGIGK